MSKVCLRGDSVWRATWAEGHAQKGEGAGWVLRAWLLPVPCQAPPSSPFDPHVRRPSPRSWPWCLGTQPWWAPGLSARTWPLRTQVIHAHHMPGTHTHRNPPQQHVRAHPHPPRMNNTHLLVRDTCPWALQALAPCPTEHSSGGHPQPQSCLRLAGWLGAGTATLVGRCWRPSPWQLQSTRTRQSSSHPVRRGRPRPRRCSS
jgi:hypothetical protein